MDDFKSRVNLMPDKMMLSLKNNGGVICYDREMNVGTHVSARAFYGVLNDYYQIKWSRAEFLTPYFEVDGNIIYGGCYDIETKKKVSRRALISSSGQAPYTYTREAIEKMIDLINLA